MKTCYSLKVGFGWCCILIQRNNQSDLSLSPSTHRPQPQLQAVEDEKNI
jgi:hypothetical protein